MATAMAADRPAGALLGLADAAEYLSISSKTLGRLAAAGRLRVVRIGTGGTRPRILVPLSEVERIAREGAAGNA